MITIIGPTASGKTALATLLAKELKGEIISGDSRQVYRGMTLGTGKDLGEYKINGIEIPYHLIDIHPAGYKYNLFEYQHDFYNVYHSIIERGTLPILCGGTGLYIEAVLNGYSLVEVPENTQLRQQLSDKSLEELTSILQRYKQLHNTSDIDSTKRAIRAIEIAEYSLTATPKQINATPIDSLIIGIDLDREMRRNRITHRLHERIEQGMIEEVKLLLDKGITPDDLIYYGLEYKFITQYLTGVLSLPQMISDLEHAIHQFAKRQMTWFRGMERRGHIIHWVDASIPNQEKVAQILDLYATRD